MNAWARRKFSEASSALQDVINEVGRRLGFKVENGLYRGKVNEIGNDGLWHLDSDAAIILEVKTTATYAIDLDTLANYRKKLAAEGKIGLEKSSILIVVGRTEKTGQSKKHKSVAQGTHGIFASLAWKC